MVFETFAEAALRMHSRRHVRFGSASCVRMWNLYSITRSQDSIRRAIRVMRYRAGNLPSLPAVYPDTMASVVRGFPRRQGAGHQSAQSQIARLARLAQSRVALPRPGNFLLRMDRQPPQDKLFAFRTTDSNDAVRPIHAKAMPVLLTTEQEWDTWLNGPLEQA